MLESLHISNYALIDTLDIGFFDGLNIITGETGAGKSIILGALSLILGERADTKTIREPGKKTVVEAVFSVEGHTELQEACDSLGIEWDDRQCILRRELYETGRSRAFVNDSPVAQSQLQTLAMIFVDIQSQHRNRLLSSKEFQLRAIDSLADNRQRLEDYRQSYQAYLKAARLLEKARQTIGKHAAEEDYIRFQFEQLEEASLIEGEQEELESRRDLLSNMTQIKQLLGSILTALSYGNANSLSLLKEAVSLCRQLAGVITRVDPLVERLESSRIEIQDIAESLAAYDDSLDGDEGELTRTQERLDRIYSLQHRHKVSSVEELIAIRERFKAILDGIANGAQTIRECEEKVAKARAAAEEKAKAVSRARKEMAEKFAAELKKRSSSLGMPNLQCRIDVTDTELSASGADDVEFLFAFNKNQSLVPVGASASGGEVSRLMLSLKSIIAEKMKLPSIIFDEIDTGVSGEMADRIGRMMRSMAKGLQVIAITHLPQIAAMGENHFKVYKKDDDQSTRTFIRHLSGEERIEEIAQMLSGSHLDDAARANALSLLECETPERKTS